MGVLIPLAGRLHTLILSKGLPGPAKKGGVGDGQRTVLSCSTVAPLSVLG